GACAGDVEPHIDCATGEVLHPDRGGDESAGNAAHDGTGRPGGGQRPVHAAGHLPLPTHVARNEDNAVRGGRAGIRSATRGGRVGRRYDDGGAGRGRGGCARGGRRRRQGG